MGFVRYNIYTDDVYIDIPETCKDPTKLLRTEAALDAYQSGHKHPVFIKSFETLEGAEDMLHCFLPSCDFRYNKYTKQYYFRLDIAFIVKDEYEIFDAPFAGPDNGSVCGCRILEYEEEENAMFYLLSNIIPKDIRYDPEDEDPAPEESSEYSLNLPEVLYDKGAAACEQGDFEAFVRDTGFTSALERPKEENYPETLKILYQHFAALATPIADLIRLSGGPASAAERYHISKRTIEGWMQGRPCNMAIRILMARDLGILRYWTAVH